MSTFKGVSSAPAKVERTYFIGPKIPNEVKEFLKLAPTIKLAVFRQILNLVVESIADSSCSNDRPVNYERLHALATEIDVAVDVVVAVFVGLDVLVRTSLRQAASLKAEILKEDLTDMGMKSEIAEELVGVVFGEEGERMKSATMSQLPRHPRLVDMSWRLDVDISSSANPRLLQPRVHARLKLDHGGVDNGGEFDKHDVREEIFFGMNQERFQRLRFAVAATLKRMEAMENKGTFKTDVR